MEPTTSSSSMPCRRFANLLVISETEYPRLVPLGKHSLLINADPGNPTSLAVTLTLEILPATSPRSSNEQLNPNPPQRIGTHSAKCSTNVPAQQPSAQHHPLYFRKRKSVPLQRKLTLAPLSRTANQTLFTPENSPKPAVTDGEYG